MDFVTIGNPGNVADTTGNPDSVGSVGYVYNIGMYEVSRDMVTKASAERVDSFDLAASYRDFGVPSNEGDDVGFRVASIPEPSTMLFGSLAAAGLMLRTKA